MTLKKNKIIDGHAISDSILALLRVEIASLFKDYYVRPKLNIVLIGNNPANNIYVAIKTKIATALGIDSFVLNLPAETSTNELVMHLSKFKEQKGSGIILQLPVPSHIDTSIALCAIDPEQDVDGFHPLNIGKLYHGYNKNDYFVPCTAMGCLELIKSVVPDLSGKQAVIIGRSIIVGKPVAALLLNANCTTSIAHSFTKNLADFTSSADIVVAAVGSPYYFTEEYFKEGAVVIDVGINKIHTEYGPKIVGDVNFERVYDKISHITPVPKGVGPMTVAHLMRNTYKAMRNICT